jgi:Fe-S cluster assembly ATP-binding protein
MTERASAPATLEVRGCAPRSADREILRGIDLTVQQGQIHALMGPNGRASRRSRT